MPQCRIHGVDMKPSKKGDGGFYCSQRVGDGYCKERVAGTNPATPRPAAGPPSGYGAPTGTVTASIESSDRANALAFAARLHQGMGTPAEALATARLALAFLREQG